MSNAIDAYSLAYMQSLNARSSLEMRRRDARSDYKPADGLAGLEIQGFGKFKQPLFRVKTDQLKLVIFDEHVQASVRLSKIRTPINWSVLHIGSLLTVKTSPSNIRSWQSPCTPAMC